MGAGAAIDQSYSYVVPSAVHVRASGSELALATCSPGGTHPWLLTARVADPPTVAAALLLLASVARSRFYTPAASIARTLELADPVVTSHGTLVRAEVLSACCGVYVRLDLPESALEIGLARRGTTNVDIGVGLRRALGQLVPGDPLGLSVGEREVAVDAGSALVVERQVKLPVRWVKGLAEVNIAQRRMTHRFTASGQDLGQFLRTVPASSRGDSPTWVGPSGRGLRLSTRSAQGLAPLGGPERVRILERIAPRITAVDVYGDERCSAWVCAIGESRLTVVFSPSAGRGFSGEGGVLETLTSDRDGALAALLADALDLDDAIDLSSVGERCGLSDEEAIAGIDALAAQGEVAMDIAAGSLFHRPLPFDAVRSVRHPRLIDADRLVESGAVRLLESADSASAVEAEVQSGGVVHRVALRLSGDRCTCPWYGRHKGDRGPCKHVLAVRLSLMRPGD